MIRLRGVSKFRVGDDAPLFDNVDLDLPNGHCIGLIGMKDTGKTRLLRMLSGLDEADRGSIQVDGTASIPLGAPAGLTPQLSGRENATFIARVLGAPVAPMVQDVAHLADLGALYDLPVSSYPGQLRTRLKFAIVMAATHDWLLVDGQLSIGGSVSRKRFMEYFETRKRRSSVLIASRTPRLLRQHCDSVVTICAGRCVYHADLEYGLETFVRFKQEVMSEQARPKTTDRSVELRAL